MTTPDQAVVLVDPDEHRGGTGTARFVLKKLLEALISVVLVIVLFFFLFRLLPGDPAATMTRDHPTSPQQIAELREKMGVDKPVLVQFRNYFRDLLHGNLGESRLLNNGRPVADMIGERLWPTILLVGSATLLAVLLGLWLGIRAAWRRDSFFDRSQTGLALTLWSVPQFWLGLMLLVVTGGLFPSRGMHSPDAAPDFLSQTLDVLHHLVLPCVTLLAVFYAQYMLIMRSSLLGEMDADYLTTARAKGLRDDLVRRRHAVPNALLPTTTLVFMQFGQVVAGAVTVEAVFSWPGLGQLTYDALHGPDLPVLQGVFTVLASAVVLMNLLAELLYRVLDPRVRTS
ncbi:dipeptide/oligopeptide/nickel ABC transporter permease [Amycolatopsis mediterranei S699]|uniref:Permease component of ABC-type dipeptide/oligopeptide/nickel transport system n=2 Tax=Amycolatopsis mediterranei TaxID=33910 RepID=A0A0H3D603_AMYMU|nr:ABC transporter permease [Amycolatopsis mediterranei]ADJ46425.1 permease component of ABC-type dipeptide/oligopeptide/nickel transport system [Amycolatopsis mediterranei U32]AEK43221.1 dipeptide/oligopeptide/nickel ABC transporter permease [Amycolatopsis mediterranei S699]AFO78136.1 dipeptide/oligopeptide/nickel ABC transporter permease [Amycolatopsis mediterranei S699]AGT85264.1 dipeptide/oligopeptide/nickel ABC transporter permease [Amycolatopsis mediterranei RB]KDO06337.1 ABC transporter